jgi:hypothetical protein
MEGAALSLIKKAITVALAVLVIAVGFFLSIAPSTDRDWTEDQKILAHAEIGTESVTIHNIRNFHYRSESDYDARYYDKTFQLDQLESLDFLLSTFSSYHGPAHAFLSFGFQGEQEMEYVSVSVEIRKEKGESYSPFWGLFKQYELSYVIADELDVVKVRTNHRDEPVYIFPVDTPKAKKQEMFLSMVTRANKLHEEPEFYSTWNNACLSNIVKHVNEVSPGKIPWSYKIVLPGYSDELAHELGFIGADVPMSELRERFIVNDIAQASEELASNAFSKAIRSRIASPKGQIE